MISIHRIVLQRLLMAWAAVSLLVGLPTYYVELQQLDGSVVALAASESRHFSPAGLNADAPTPDELRTLAQRANEFVQRSFVVIEVYDRDKRRLLEAVNPGFAHIEEELKRHKHSFPIDAESHYQKFVVGAETVVQVLVPLRTAAGSDAGFFEGVFIVDHATLDELRSHVWRTLGAVLFAVLATTVLLYPVIIALNRDVLRFSQEVLKGNLEMASVLGAAIAKRDSDTGDHNYRVALYAIRLGEAINLPAGEMRQLILGAFLHDVGKIGISDNILLKPGKLSAEEFAVMRTHVALGVDIVEQSDWLQGARAVIEGHHEKFDGTGYLRGLRGTQIPLNARIFAIVDVFDALSSRRPYKEPMALEQALAIIRKDAGSHFDPLLVERFLDIAPAIHTSIAGAGEAALQALLREQAMHYFLRASIEAKDRPQPA
ncbi:MAG: response regulator [Betaproteobacteria bacterium HGW-Betaproteobacteria-12]|nr:MAG: response regulator [Betaproteobacteria bacterium HGW-Betaproteobacteria-12]